MVSGFEKGRERKVESVWVGEKERRKREGERERGDER